MAQLDTILRVDLAAKDYPASDGGPGRAVIRDLQLEVRRGEFVCLLGPSGCGKTSLLNMIAGLDPHYSGRIEVGSDGGRSPRLGYVFQNPRLLPWRTVGENLQLAIESAGVSGAIVDELLQTMGVADTLDMFPRQLSTGMQRRVALVRAFAIEPDLLLMDEPLVSLDRGNAERIRELLLDLWQRFQATVLFVTHDIDEAVYLGDRIVELTPPPTRVARSLSVDLPRGQRHDPSRILDFRRRNLSPVTAVARGA